MLRNDFSVFGVDTSRDVDSVRVEILGFPSTWCFSLTTTALTCCSDMYLRSIKCMMIGSDDDW